MNLKEKIGQVLMVGMDGTTPSRAFLKFLKERQPGGVILFSRNLTTVSQIVRLTNTLQRHARVPLLIAVDQEGGRVSRLPKGFTLFPAANVIGSLGSVDLAYRVAEITARELRAVGINMNMAPVLDVNSNPDNPIIGDRAFSEKPGTVNTMGLATIAGLQDNRVVACGKHFPGHGDTRTDSHKVLPVVSKALHDLEEVELRPFVHAVENRLAALMTAHVTYPAIDGEPATLSRAAITGLLRGQMHFSGLVVSDDLLMGAISERHAPGDAAVRALVAGVDMALFGRGPDCGEEAFVAIEKAVRQGLLAEAQLDQAVLHVLSVKEHFVLPYASTDPKLAKEVVACPAHRRFHQELTESVDATHSRRT